MAMACSICTHPERQVIDEQIVGKIPNRRIASLRGLTEASVRRHKATHLPAAMVKVAVEREVRHARTLLQRVEALVVRTEDLLARAEQSGSVVQALAAVRELRGMYELLGKATGELKPDGQVLVLNLQSNPEWLEIQGKLLVALAPFPEARVAAALAINGHTG